MVQFYLNVSVELFHLVPSGKRCNYPHFNATGVIVMKNTGFNITVPHSFSPISALNAESKSYITSLRFNIHGTFQINQSKFFFSIMHLLRFYEAAVRIKPITL